MPELVRAREGASRARPSMPLAAKWVAGTVALLTTVLGLTGVVATAPPAGAVTKLSPACATLSDVIRIITRVRCRRRQPVTGLGARAGQTGGRRFCPMASQPSRQVIPGQISTPLMAKKTPSLITWSASLGTRWTMATLVKKFTGALTRVKGAVPDLPRAERFWRVPGLRAQSVLAGQANSCRADRLHTRSDHGNLSRKSRYAYTPRPAQWRR